MYLRKSRSDLKPGAAAEDILSRHEQTLRELAAQQGIMVDAVYREVVSGENIAGRPMMQRLLSEVESGMWEGVLVMEIERLARGNTVDQGIIIQSFLCSGTKIITPMKVYSPEDEFDEEYFEFSLFMSRREYKTINRRMQRGRLSSVKEGKFVGSVPPYGYQKHKLPDQKGYTLTPIPAQAEVVRYIFTAYTSGQTAKAIAAALNAKGICTAKGNLWKQNAILDLLKNPVYIGKIRWNARKIKKSTHMGQTVIHRPHNEQAIIAEGMHPAIVEEALFMEAAKRFHKRSRVG